MESQESLTKKTNLRKYRSKTYISLFHNLSQSSSKENNVILETSHIGQSRQSQRDRAEEGRAGVARGAVPQRRRLGLDEDDAMVALTE